MPPFGTQPPQEKAPDTLTQEEYERISSDPEFPADLVGKTSFSPRDENKLYGFFIKRFGKDRSSTDLVRDYCARVRITISEKSAPTVTPSQPSLNSLNQRFGVVTPKEKPKRNLSPQDLRSGAGVKALVWNPKTESWEKEDE